MILLFGPRVPTRKVLFYLLSLCLKMFKKKCLTYINFFSIQRSANFGYVTSAEFTVASQHQSNKCLGEKRKQFPFICFFPFGKSFSYTGFQIRAGTREYSLQAASFQTQANTTASLNIAFNLNTDCSVLEKLQFKGEPQKFCYRNRVHTFSLHLYFLLMP